MSDISFEPPRGMRDFYPEDMAWRNRVFDAWRAAADAFGFQPYDACVVESLALLQRKSGEEVSEQIYAFEDKSGRALALRPEMTPTLARMVAARQGRLHFPIKWSAIAQCFRYERMTRGRKREHYQLNLDIIGSDDVLCEAELLGAAVNAVRRMGLPDDAWRIHLSSRALLGELLAKSGIPAAQHTAVFMALDKRGKISDEDIAATGLDDPELTVTIDYPESADEGAEILSFTIAFSRGAEDKLTDWDEVLEAMEAGEESEEAGEPADEDAVAYLRVGESAIIYEISYDDFKALMACSYNDLRHTELFPAETEDIASLTVTLDGETYELTTTPPEDAESDEDAGDGEAAGWYFGGEKIDIADIEAAIASLSVSRFAKDTSPGATEISFTAVLDMEGSPEVSVRLYRIDGESCLASVNGESIGYVPRSQVVNLIEAVNAIVLG